MTRALATSLLFLAACAPATADEPTWLADVRPILVANCVRCHGYPPIGGAPGTFRLDRYDDDFIDGAPVRGAATMAPFIAARASERGDMPPRGALLSSRQKDVLARWATMSAPLGSRAGNRPPTATLLSQSVGGGRATLVVELADPDGDVVFGSLAGYPLRPGRQTVVVDLAPLPAGELPLLASLSDDEVSITVELGAIMVPAKPSAPPRLTIQSPGRDAILRGAVTITFEVDDPDTAPPLVTVTLEARRGAERHPIPLTNMIVRGVNTTTWDTSALPAATNWRLHGEISDGGTTVTVDTPELIVSRATTSDGYADVQPILDANCASCHFALLDPVTMAPDFSKLEDIRLYAGLAWRKVVQLREMPPPSFDLVIQPPPAPLSESDRARLGAWLLAGAPP